MTDLPIVAIVGAGVTGGRIARLLSLARVARIAVCDTKSELAASVAHFTDGAVIDIEHAAVADLAILACPGPHTPLAQELINSGVATVSLSDDLDDVGDLLKLDALASVRGVPLVVGAAMSPGLSGLLARYLVSQIHTVDEIHVALHGTGGPACAHQHHRALGGTALSWHDNEWVRRPAGAGRELCWFPEPVNSYDCYHAELADTLLLHQLFPSVGRISARMSANRRDRLTARLPMLSPPHKEGGVGATRVEVRGANASGQRETLIVGAAIRAGMAAAIVASRIARLAVTDRLFPGTVILGDERLPTEEILQGCIADGVTVHQYNGVTRPADEETETEPDAG